MNAMERFGLAMNRARQVVRTNSSKRRIWSTLWSAATDTPVCASVLTASCALLVHPWAGRPLSRPISLELHDGNVLAFVTLVGLAWVTLTVGARFWSQRLLFSAAGCVLCVALLTVIPLTEPSSTAHNVAYVGLVTVAMGLFLVWAIDTFDFTQVLPPFVPIAFGLPFYTTLGTGGLQLLLIVSLLVALNLTFRHLETRESG